MAVVDSEFVRLMPPVISNPGAAILDAGGYPAPVANPVLGITGPVQMPVTSGGWPRPIANPVMPIAPVQVLADYPGSDPTASGAVPVTTAQSGGLLSSLPGWLVLAVLALGAVFAFGQAPDSTLYVRHFSGSTVGDKLTNAIAACNPDTSIHCILVLDPSLKATPEGTLPALCSQCDLADYRNGLPWASGPGPSGSCGSLSGDSSSTDCGTDNSVGAAYNDPPYTVQTYGFNLAGGASGETGVAIGSNTGTNATFNQTVAIGDYDFSNNDPSTGIGGYESVFIGSANAAFFGGPDSGVGASFSDAIGLGARNYQTFNSSASGDFTNTFALGYQNLSTQNGNVVPHTFRDFVALGTSNGNSIHEGTDVVAIGDSALSGGNSNPGPSYTDVVAIGDVAASLPPDGSSTLVAIGFCPMCIGDDGTGIDGPLTESIAIGDEAVNAGENTHDLIGIGDNAMFGPHSGYTSGNDNIAIGNYAGAGFKAGSENIAIGTNACAVGYGGTDGNSNNDGSHQICIGDEAGQSVSHTVALDNIIVIGNHAQADQANEIVIGDPTIQKVKIYYPKLVLSMPSGAISANTCTTPTVQAYAGVDATSTFTTGFATSPVGVTGWGSTGGLVLALWPDSTPANGFDWAVCNQTASSITAGAISINVSVQ